MYGCWNLTDMPSPIMIMSHWQLKSTSGQMKPTPQKPFDRRYQFILTNNTTNSVGSALHNHIPTINWTTHLQGNSPITPKVGRCSILMAGWCCMISRGGWKSTFSRDGWNDWQLVVKFMFCSVIGSMKLHDLTGWLKERAISILYFGFMFKRQQIVLLTQTHCVSWATFPCLSVSFPWRFDHFNPGSLVDPALNCVGGVFVYK